MGGQHLAAQPARDQQPTSSDPRPLELFHDAVIDPNPALVLRLRPSGGGRAE
jgi:hypothetical protein